MIDIKSTVTSAASQVTERLSRAASDTLGAFTDSISRAGLQVVDGVLAKASKLVGAPEEDTQEASGAAEAPELQAAPRGKAAAKKRKQARLAMQRLVKAAKRTASAAHHKL